MGPCNHGELQWSALCGTGRIVEADSGVDMIHRLTDPNDPGCFLWGDGAGAVVLEAGTEAGFIGAAFQADGAYASGWGILAGGTFEPASIEAVKAGRTQMRRVGGNYPKSVNEDNWPRLFRRLSDQCSFSPDQVDQLLFTQISKSSIEVAAERCNVPVEKCHMVMQKYGYTGSACIAMALDNAIELGKIKRGDLVVMIQSGLGWIASKPFSPHRRLNRRGQLSSLTRICDCFPFRVFAKNS